MYGVDMVVRVDDDVDGRARAEASKSSSYVSVKTVQVSVSIGYRVNNITNHSCLKEGVGGSEYLPQAASGHETATFAFQLFDSRHPEKNFSHEPDTN